MLISHDKKFIFFHVAKVAGLSLREALNPYIREPEKFKIRRPLKMIDGKVNPLYLIWESALLHASAKVTRDELGEPIFSDYFKFAFVRNPWDWQVSMYHFILKEKEHPHHQQVSTFSSFSDYVKWMIGEEKPFARGAKRFQKDMLCDELGNIIVDYVGRYENLDYDFSYICQFLNLNAKIPFLNKSTHKPYQYYYDQDTYNLVAKYAKDDIDLFGYSFESYQNSAEYFQRKAVVNEI